jgi:hypothetical protein
LAKDTCLMAFSSSSLLVIFVPDLDRLFCHPVVMVRLSVTPMHHLMIMGSSAASGRRRQRSAWQ